MPATREGFDAEVSSQMLGVVASLLGLLLAFVIVIEYQNFGGAQDNVGQEADSLAAITRDSHALAPADGARVRAAIGTRATAFYNDSVKQLNAALIARRDRLASATGGLPSLVLTLILLGAFIILGYVLLVGSRSFWFHAIGACAIALVIALSLVVLVDLSYPFSGSLNVSSAPFQTGALAQFFHQ